MERPVTSRVRVALNALILLVGCLAGTALAVATGPQAHADSVPPPPPGWTTVFGDDFAAPPGGKLEMTASIEQPDPASGLGYCPAAACRRAAGRPSTQNDAGAQRGRAAGQRMTLLGRASRARLSCRSCSGRSWPRRSGTG